MFRFLTPFILFVSFLLLLLVSISVPVTRTFTLFQLVAQYSVSTSSVGLPFTVPGVSASAGGSVTFGLWGYCTTDFTAQVAGLSKTTAGECSPSHVGFQIDSKLIDLLQLKTEVNDITNTLTAALVLHPVACILAFLSLIFAVIHLVKPLRRLSLITVILASLAAFLCTIAFIIDIVVVVVARNTLQGINDDLHVYFGNCVWLTLVATLCLWIGSVGACLGFFRPRHPRNTANNEEKY